MGLLDIIKIPNQFLEQYATFRGLKFIMGVYLIIIVINIIILLYNLIIKKHYWWDFHYGRTMPKTRGVMNQRWREIVKIFQQQNSERYKTAVVEGKEILFDAFKRIGYDGNTLGEQLNLMIGHQISNLEKVKEANQIAENVINDVNYVLEEDVARETVISFGEALKEIEAIGEIGL